MWRDAELEKDFSFFEILKFNFVSGSYHGWVHRTTRHKRMKIFSAHMAGHQKKKLGLVPGPNTRRPYKKTQRKFETSSSPTLPFEFFENIISSWHCCCFSQIIKYLCVVLMILLCRFYVCLLLLYIRYWLMNMSQTTTAVVQNPATKELCDAEINESNISSLSCSKLNQLT